MHAKKGDAIFEKLVESLNDDAVRAEYAASIGTPRIAFFPRLLGKALMWLGNLLYGHNPSYLKFRAVEVIARVPYQSWESAIYSLLTLFYSNEARALALSETARFARHAQDNETMHVVMLSKLASQHGHRGGVVRHTLIPLIFALCYFWTSYWLYLLNPRWSFQLNYMFEDHAYRQYARFLEMHGEMLKVRPIDSEFLRWYGRNPRSEYEFLVSVRNDELIHRNQSVHAAGGAALEVVQTVE